MIWDMVISKLIWLGIRYLTLRSRDMARDYLSEKFEVIKLYNYRVYVWLILEFLLWWIYDVLENSSNKRLELKSVVARNNLWDLFEVWYFEINMKRRGLCTLRVW